MSNFLTAEKNYIRSEAIGWAFQKVKDTGHFDMDYIPMVHGPRHSAGRHPNALFQKYRDGIAMIAIRDIEEGEPITCDGKILAAIFPESEQIKNWIASFDKDKAPPPAESGINS